MEVYLGTIMPWPMEFAPYGWMFCRGQALPVTQYQALFSLLGTRYGGNGSSTFCLPDLQGRAIAGVSSTDQNFQIAHTIGQKQATYNLTNLPAHAHTFSGNYPVTTNVNVTVSQQAYNGSASSITPDPNSYLAVGNTSSGDAAYIYKSGVTPNTTLSPMTATGTSNGTVSIPVTNTSVVGSSGSIPITIDTITPSLVLNYIIAINGIYPTQG